jgi:hypothetical protein
MSFYHTPSIAPLSPPLQPPGLAKTRPVRASRTAPVSRENHRLVVAGAIQAHRSTLRISHTRLGRALGVHDSVVRRKTNGASPFTVADLRQLAGTSCHSLGLALLNDLHAHFGVRSEVA